MEETKGELRETLVSRCREAGCEVVTLGRLQFCNRCGSQLCDDHIDNHDCAGLHRENLFGWLRRARATW